MKPGLLIASPQMRDRFFERTLVLMVHHDEEGALGIVINRDGRVSVGTVIERLEIGVGPANPDAPTWWGGPVDGSTGFVVFRGRVDPDMGWNLGDDIAVSQSADQLARMVREKRPFHLVLGYAGWGPGQLDGEIESGSWLFADADPALVFDTPMAERYDLALAQLGLTAKTVWMQPIDE